MKGEIRKFYRARDNKMIAGVCGGLAKHFGIDPLLVRIFFILLIFANGIGIVLYIILFILAPKEPEEGN